MQFVLLLFGLANAGVPFEHAVSTRGCGFKSPRTGSASVSTFGTATYGKGLAGARNQHCLQLWRPAVLGEEVGLSPARSPTRTRPSDRRNRPPAVSSDLEDPPRRHSVRGTRASRQRRSEEGAGAQDDPRTAQSRLPRRTAFGSIGQPGMIASDFRPWLIREVRGILRPHGRGNVESSPLRASRQRSTAISATDQYPTESHRSIVVRDPPSPGGSTPQCSRQRRRSPWERAPATRFAVPAMQVGYANVDPVFGVLNGDSYGAV